MTDLRRPVLILLPTPNLCACECRRNHSVEHPVCTFRGEVAAFHDSILLMCEPCHTAHQVGISDG